MNQVENYDQEAFFNEKELDAKKIAVRREFRWLGWVRALPLVLYSYLSGYGQSLIRPFRWLTGLILIGALGYYGAPYLSDAKISITHCTWSVNEASNSQYMFKKCHRSAVGFPQSLGLSITSTGGFLGFTRMFPTSDLEIHWFLQVFRGFQAIFGAVLIFLIGLALRNRFRIR